MNVNSRMGNITDTSIKYLIFSKSVMDILFYPVEKLISIRQILVLLTGYSIKFKKLIIPITEFPMDIPLLNPD